MAGPRGVYQPDLSTEMGRGLGPQLTWFESKSSFLRGARRREILASDPVSVLAAARDGVEGAG